MKKIECDLQELTKQISVMNNLYASSQMKSKLEDINSLIIYSSGETVKALADINTELSNMEKNMMQLFKNTEIWIQETYNSFHDKDNKLAGRMKNEFIK